MLESQGLGEGVGVQHENTRGLNHRSPPKMGPYCHHMIVTGSSMDLGLPLCSRGATDPTRADLLLHYCGWMKSLTIPFSLYLGHYLQYLGISIEALSLEA